MKRILMLATGGTIASMESGQGLRGLLRSIRVPFPEEGAVSLDGLWFRSYQGDGWAAAVCGHCKPPKNVEKVLDISTV